MSAYSSTKRKMRERKISIAFSASLPHSPQKSESLNLPDRRLRQNTYATCRCIWRENLLVFGKSTAHYLVRRTSCNTRPSALTILRTNSSLLAETMEKPVSELANCVPST